MIRFYYSVTYSRLTTTGHVRNYYRLFTDNPNEPEVLKYAREKAADRRIYTVEVYKMKHEVIRPEYTDANGVFHLASERTEATRIDF